MATRTDAEVAKLTQTVNDARRVAYDEAGRIGLAHVLLALEAEAQALRDHLRETRSSVAQYPTTEG